MGKLIDLWEASQVERWLACHTAVVQTGALEAKMSTRWTPAPVGMGGPEQQGCNNKLQSAKFKWLLSPTVLQQSQIIH